MGHFELVDKTKPGHRKILAMFLVDPTLRIISTANVLRRRPDWWNEKVLHETRTLGNLQLEMQEHIINSVEDFPDWDGEGEDIQTSLINEGTILSCENEDSFERYGFNLCEHYVQCLTRFGVGKNVSRAYLYKIPKVGRIYLSL